jgi:hypothetical protein
VFGAESAGKRQPLEESGVGEALLQKTTEVALVVLARERAQRTPGDASTRLRSAANTGGTLIRVNPN